jgi:hypothetical protein
VGKNNFLESFGTFQNSKFLRFLVETEEAYMISQNFMHYPRLESSLFESPAAGVRGDHHAEPCTTRLKGCKTVLEARWAVAQSAAVMIMSHKYIMAKSPKNEAITNAHTVAHASHPSSRAKVVACSVQGFPGWRSMISAPPFHVAGGA